MKKGISFFAIVVSLFLFSCSPSRDKMSEKITKMELELKNAPVVDSNAVNELLGAYQNFASRFPSDSMAPEYLFKAGGLAIGFKRGVQAVEIFESIIQTYPAYRKIPECYFMEAFAYENVINNFGKASEYYNTFIAKFPEHELADDAAAALKFLGKSPEEMVREFERMNADSLNTAAQ